MDTKGSITIFLTLILSLIITLLSTMLLSAKIAAGRVQIALAVDQALFSTLAKYDRSLFEEYHLLYMDGGYGFETLQLGKALDEMEKDISYILIPNQDRLDSRGDNLLQLTYEDGEITGYTLATDNDGSVFKNQVVDYMKDTLGIQGIALLTQEVTKQMEIMESQGERLEAIEQQGTLDDYENIKAEAEALKRKQEEEQQAVQEKQQTAEAMSMEEKRLGEHARATLDMVSAKKETGVLNLVVPDSHQISGWTAANQGLLSKRPLQTGMGVIHTNQDEGLVEKILFQEYLLQNINFYQNEKRSDGPMYGIERILFQKTSDRENLEAMVKRLLLIREAANAASLCMDTVKMEEIRMLAECLALLLEMPFVQPILEGVMIVAWSYAESLVDVAALLDGADVPLIKDSAGWQVSFGEIPGALISPGSYYKESPGVSYEMYLRTFLMMQSEETKIKNSMEVIELSIREIQGKEKFSFDCAIDTIEARFKIRSEDLISFEIVRKRSYRTEGGV